MTTTLSQQINDLFAREDWRTARARIEKEMAQRGDEPGHWLLSRLATTYYEQRQYKKALALLEKARSVAANCPLVLWDYAGTLDALGRSEEAIAVYLSLLRRDPKNLADDECGEGLEWAVGLLTDCFYRVSVCLKHLHRPEEAAKFFFWFAELVAAGAQSIYAEAGSELLKHILEVFRASSPRRPRRAPRNQLKEFVKEAVHLLHAA